tara:strand:- start:64 stop:297 length:234 start_codon:yes stop_codon:yes gene_type:complete
MSSVRSVIKRVLSVAVQQQHPPEYFYDYAQYSFKLIETTPPVCKFCNKPITKFQCMSNIDMMKMICPLFKNSHNEFK